MVATKKSHICFVTTGLYTGGAEVMLYKLLSGLDQERFEASVISLRDHGTLGEKIEALGIKVYSINLNRSPFALYSLVRLIKRLNPDLIQGWMYHGNLGALLSNLFLQKKIPIVWSIHNSLQSLGSENRLTRNIIKLNANFSRFATQILYVGKKIKEEHEQFGFDSVKGLVIPNGFETEIFVPSEEFRSFIRQELNIPEKAFLIGLIGRYHPVKDHHNFLKAAKLVVDKYPNTYFLLAGRDVDKNNLELMKIIKDLGLDRQVKTLGERKDIPQLLASLDIACSSSYSEAFPLILGEAMSCGVPCVATDVGDSAWILGDTGFVVPPRNPGVLANAIEKVIKLEPSARRKLGDEARERIVEIFSLESVVAQYEAVYESFDIEENS